MKIIQWLKSFFKDPTHPANCPHHWVAMGAHENHPMFGQCKFWKCEGPCDGRYIQQLGALLPEPFYRLKGC